MTSAGNVTGTIQLNVAQALQAARSLTTALRGVDAVSPSIDLRSMQSQLQTTAKDARDLDSALSSLKGGKVSVDTRSAQGSLQKLQGEAKDTVAALDAISGAKITIDTGGVVGDLQNAQKAAKDTESTFANLKGTIEVDGADGIGTMQDAIKTAKDLQSALSNLKGTIEINGVGTIKDATAAASELRSAVGSIKGGDVDFSQAASQLSQMAGDAGTVNQQLSGFAGGGAVGAAGGGGGGGIGNLGFLGAFFKGIGNAKNLEQELVNVKTALGDVSDTDFSKLNKAIIQIGVNSQYSSVEVAQISEDLAKAGYDVTAQINGGMLPAVVNLASATGTDLNSAVTGIVQVMAIFQPSMVGAANAITNASDAADIFTIVANGTTADVGDLIVGLRTLGPEAAILGISFPEATAAIGVFTQYGLKASDVAISLTRGLQNLSSPTSDGAALMEQYGFTIFDASGKFVGLTSILDQLKANFGDLNDQQKLNIVNTLFGQEAMDVYSLALKSGADPLKALISLIDQETAAASKNGVAADQAAKRQDTFNFALQRASEGISTALGSLFTPLLPLLQQATDGFATLVSIVATLPAPVRAVAGAFVAVKAAMGAAELYQVASGFLAIGRAGTLAGAGAAEAGVGAEVAGAGITGMLGPIALVALAAAGLYIAFQTNFLGIQDLVKNTLGGLGDFADIVKGLFGFGVDDKKKDPSKPKADTPQSAMSEVNQRLALARQGKTAAEIDKIMADQGKAADTLTKKYDLLNAKQRTRVNAMRAQGKSEQEISDYLKKEGKSAEYTTSEYQYLRAKGMNPVSAALYTMGDAFIQFNNKYPNAVFKALGTTLKGASKLAQSFGNYFGDALGGNAEKSLKNLPKPLQGIAHGFGTVLDTVHDLNQAWKTGGFTGVLSVLPHELGDLGTGFRRGMYGVGDLFRDAAKYTGPFTGALKAVGAQMDDVGRIGQDFAKGISYALKGDFGMSLKWAGEAAKDFGSLVSDSFDVVTNTLSGLGSVAISLGNWSLSVGLPAVITITEGLGAAIAAAIVSPIVDLGNWSLTADPSKVAASITGGAAAVAGAIGLVIAGWGTLAIAGALPISIPLILGAGMLLAFAALAALLAVGIADYFGQHPMQAIAVVVAVDAVIKLASNVLEILTIKLAFALAGLSMDIPVAIGTVIWQAGALTAQFQLWLAGQMAVATFHLTVDLAYIIWQAGDLVGQFQLWLAGQLAIGAFHLAVDLAYITWQAGDLVGQFQVWLAEQLVIGSFHLTVDLAYITWKAGGLVGSFQIWLIEQLALATISLTVGIAKLLWKAGSLVGDFEEWLVGLLVGATINLSVGIGKIVWKGLTLGADFVGWLAGIVGDADYSGMWSAFEGGVTSAFNGIQGLFDDITHIDWSGLADGLGDVLDGIKDQFTSWYNDTIAILNKLPGFHFSPILTTEQQQTKNAHDAGANAGTGAKGAAQGAMGKVFGSGPFENIGADPTVERKRQQPGILPKGGGGGGLYQPQAGLAEGAPAIADMLANLSKMPSVANNATAGLQSLATSGIAAVATQAAGATTATGAAGTALTTLGAVHAMPKVDLQDQGVQENLRTALQGVQGLDGVTGTMKANLDKTKLDAGIADARHYNGMTLATAIVSIVAKQAGQGAVSAAKGAAASAIVATGNAGNTTSTTTFNAIDNVSSAASKIAAAIGNVPPGHNTDITQTGGEAVGSQAIATLQSISSIPESWHTAISQAGAENVTGSAETTYGAITQIPTGWFSSITQSGAEGVTDAADAAAAAINSVPESKYSTVSASVSGTGDVLALVDAINSMHDVTTHATVITQTVATDGHARGGYTGLRPTWLAERGPEALRFPDGKIGLAEKKAIYSVPKGTFVYTAAQTRAMGIESHATGGYVGSIVGNWKRLANGFFQNLFTGVIKKGIKAEDGTYVNPDFYGVQQSRVGGKVTSGNSIADHIAYISRALNAFLDNDGKHPSDFTSAAKALNALAVGETPITRQNFLDIVADLKKAKIDPEDVAQQSLAISQINALARNVAPSTTSVSDASTLFSATNWSKRVRSMANPNNISGLFSDRRRINTDTFATKQGFIEHYGSGMVPSGVGGSTTHVTYVSQSVEPESLQDMVQGYRTVQAVIPAIVQSGTQSLTRNSKPVVVRGL